MPVLVLRQQCLTSLRDLAMDAGDVEIGYGMAELARKQDRGALMTTSDEIAHKIGYATFASAARTPDEK